jgi:hypothetical protein
LRSHDSIDSSIVKFVAGRIATQLYGLEPHDPFTIVVAVVLMLAVAGFAGLPPGDALPGLIR